MDGPSSADFSWFEDFRLDRHGGGLFGRDESGSLVLVTVGSRALDILDAAANARSLQAYVDLTHHGLWARSLFSRNRWPRGKDWSSAWLSRAPRSRAMGSLCRDPL
jgi:hypothetical protein